MVICWVVLSPAARGKPAGGPAPVDPPVTPKVTPEDAAHQKYSDQVNARNKADLLRAKYEKANRPGPVPDAAAKEFEEIVTAFRAAIDIDPRSEIATYCRQRLAGAYIYTGDFEAGLRILTEAVNVAAGPLDQIKACHGVAYHYLQAMHKPAEALRWFKRSHSQLAKIEDPSERGKWEAATAQGIARCEEELKRQGAPTH